MKHKFHWGFSHFFPIELQSKINNSLIEFQISSETFNIERSVNVAKRLLIFKKKK